MGTPPPSRRAWWPRAAALAGLAGAAAGAWFGYHAWSGGADRRAALALAETAPPADALPAR